MIDSPETITLDGSETRAQRLPALVAVALTTAPCVAGCVVN